MILKNDDIKNIFPILKKGAILHRTPFNDRISLLKLNPEKKENWIHLNFTAAMLYSLSNGSCSIYEIIKEVK